MDINTNFEQLVHRYLEGNLKESEHEELISLLKNNDNYDRFEHLKNNWFATESDLSTDSWRRLSFRISSLEKSSISTIRLFRNYWSSVAAAILIIGLFMSTFFFYQKNKNFIAGTTIIEAPRGEKSNIFLPDGTEVSLNANSTISYSNFSKKNREVKLVGEAYFKVMHSDNIPFIVTTPRCNIKVLGTEFNVMAYEMLKRNEVTLFKGSVEVEAEKQSFELKVGESFLISDDTLHVQIANLQQAYSWVEDNLNFQKTPFSELVMRLENWYNVDIIYSTDQFFSTEFTGTFKNEETIWQVLDILSVYMPINYSKVDNRRIELSIN